MNKAKMLKVLNPVLAVSFLLVAGGGIMRSLSPDIIPPEIFYRVHPLLGWSFSILAVLHLWLNWNWVKALVKRAGPAQ